MSLGVDTHLNIHVGAVVSQSGKLLGTHIIQTNQSGQLDCLIGHVLLGSSNEQSSKEPGLMERALTRYLIKNGIYEVEVNRPDRSKRRPQGKSQIPRMQ